MALFAVVLLLKVWATDQQEPGEKCRLSAADPGHPESDTLGVGCSDVGFNKPRSEVSGGHWILKN